MIPGIYLTILYVVIHSYCVDRLLLVLFASEQYACNKYSEISRSAFSLQRTQVRQQYRYNSLRPYG